jgi:hypothetical protein
VGPLSGSAVGTWDLLALKLLAEGALNGGGEFAGVVLIGGELTGVVLNGGEFAGVPLNGGE